MYVRIVTNWRNPGTNSTEYRLIAVPATRFDKLCEELNKEPIDFNLCHNHHPLGRIFRKITMEEMRYISYKVQDLVKLSSPSNVYILPNTIDTPARSSYPQKEIDNLMESIKKSLRIQETPTQPTSSPPTRNPLTHCTIHTRNPPLGTAYTESLVYSTAM
jgi:hypothetical protein